MICKQAFCTFSFLIVVGIVGCTNYSFDRKNYEDSLYNLLVYPPPRGNYLDSSTNVIGQIISSARGMGTPIPPGAFADYGSLLDMQGQHQEARVAWSKETELFPDSRILLEKLISRKLPAASLYKYSDQQDFEGSKFHKQLRSIVIWPPFNQTRQPSAAGAFHATINHPLIKRGYYVFPVLTTQIFLKSRGLLGSQNITASILEQINNEIGADAILTITITEWTKSKNFLGFPGQSVDVGAEYKLIEVPSGNALWRMSTRKEVNEQVTGGAGGPIMITANDHRIPARVLNEQAIRLFSKEFPRGPYSFRTTK